MSFTKKWQLYTLKSQQQKKNKFWNSYPWFFFRFSSWFIFPRCSTSFFEDPLEFFTISLYEVLLLISSGSLPMFPGVSYKDSCKLRWISGRNDCRKFMKNSLENPSRNPRNSFCSNPGRSPGKIYSKSPMLCNNWTAFYGLKKCFKNIILGACN